MAHSEQENQQEQMDKLDGLSMDIEQTERDKLRSVFPQCFVEDKLDIDKLLSMCGEYITDEFERYEFKWKGKSECLQLAQKRSTGALRPCPGESVNFDTTGNLYIEGDNLEVLKLLQTSYYRKVKMIYIDPPYNTGNDFVYADDFKDPMARYKEVTSQTTKSNPETMGRYHTNWLNMMYPRLRLAANLLRDDGVCFISIDDNEVHNLRKVCDEVFGEENFLTCITRSTGTPTGGGFDGFVNEIDYILVYSKSIIDVTINGLLFSEEDAKIYNMEDERGTYLIRPLRRTGGEDRREDRPTMFFPIIAPDGSSVFPIGPTGYESRWICGKERFDEMLSDGLIEWKHIEKDGIKTWAVYQKFYLENRTKQPGNLWVDIEGNKKATRSIRELFEGYKIFDFPKPTGVIKKIVALCTNNNDIILDFFSGSATTAHAVMQLNAEDGGNRRFIMVQLPEVCDEKSEAYKSGYKNICEVGKERIRRAGSKILAKVQEENAQLTLEQEEKPLPDVGFRVFKLDTSNLKIWDNTPIPGGDVGELERRLRGMLEIVKDDRDNLDVVYEVMLKLGQDLCEEILELEIGAGSPSGGKTVYGVGAECEFIVCLARHITAEDAEEMAEYAPGRIIFTDGCFHTSSDKRNVQLTLKDRGINMKML